MLLTDGARAAGPGSEQRPAARRTSERKTLFALSLGHTAVDTYANFPTPLLPLFIVKFDLSVSDIGVLISVLSLTSSFSQLAYGYWSDRMRTSLFIIFGPMVAAVFTCSMGFVTSYSALVACLILGGAGISAYHPQAAAAVGRLSGERRGLSMSTFTTAGTVGFAIGPLIATYTATYLGLRGMPLVMVFGLLTSLALWRWMNGSAPSGRGATARPGLVSALKGCLKPFALLYVVATLRASVVIAFVNFLVLYLKDKNASLVSIGWIASLFALAGAFGGIAGGYLSDRIGRKRVLLLSTLLAPPFLLVVFHLDGLLFVLSLMLAGFVFNAATPVNVVIAQELLPDNTSAVSSLIMGAAWGIGGLLVGLYSLAAEAYGLTVVLQALALLPFLIACLIPPIKVRR